MLKKLLTSAAITLGATATVLMFYPFIDDSVSIMRLLPGAIVCGASAVGSIVAKWKVEEMEEEEQRVHELNNPIDPELQVQIEQNQANQEVQEALGGAPNPNLGMAYAVRVVNFLRGNER